MTLPLSQPIPIHHFFVTGFFGLITNALNLLPIFRLDGGRASTAVLGMRVSAIGSAWFLLSALSIALSGSTVAWTWGMFVLLFQRKPEIPSRDDVTVADDVRKGVWVSSVVLALLALLPFPGSLGLL
jgi:membrane-associated protease RseP (regulator of RpoE activity)